MLYSSNKSFNRIFIYQWVHECYFPVVLYTRQDPELYNVSKLPVSRREDFHSLGDWSEERDLPDELNKDRVGPSTVVWSCFLAALGKRHNLATDSITTELTASSKDLDYQS